MRREKTIDDDAVSITTGYILNIAIATLVLSTLLVGMRGTFDNVESTTAQAGAEDIAEKVASEITQADRLARVDANVSGTLTFRLRDSIADSDYSVEVTDGWVNVSTATGDVYRRRYVVSSDVNGDVMNGGGSKTIEYEGSPDPEVNVIG
jgi:hypothetical protein